MVAAQTEITRPLSDGRGSELEEGAEALRLNSAYGNFGLLFIVHLELEARFEPRYDFPYTVNIHKK